MFHQFFLTATKNDYSQKKLLIDLKKKKNTFFQFKIEFTFLFVAEEI